MKSNLLRLAPLLALATNACSKPEQAPAGRPNVVFLCLDTVRADHLGSYGYARRTTPAIDALAARALVFSDTSATAGWTKPSVPSFLTGTYPCQHGVYEGSAHAADGEVTDLLPAESFTLAEAFQQHGYRTAAFVNNAQLRAGNGFEQGFEAYTQGPLDAREIRWHGLDWIDSWLDGSPDRGSDAGPEEPFFLYLHFLDAHWPYPAPEEWLARFAPLTDTARFRGSESKALYAAINDGTHTMTPEDRAALVALYDGALAYLDSELGRFFTGLEVRGLAQDTLVCIVADHGEEFGEHGKVGHGHGLWEGLLRVPWILYRPGQPAQRVTTPVSLIDLYPTLLAAAGIPAPAGLEGLDRLAQPDASRPILAEHKAPDRYFQSLRVGSEKLQRRFTPPRNPQLAEQVLPVVVGTRWEVEFEPKGDAFVATQLKPRDEEISDPPELKGRIEALGAEEFRIAGIRVRYDAESRRQVEPGTSGPELANGQIVKVRGPYADGALRAERIKFYAPEEDVQLELRATVEAIEQSGGAGTLTLGGFVLALTPETELKDAERKSKKRGLAREEIAAQLEAGAGAYAAAKNWESERTSYDLARDAAELAPQPSAAGAGLDAQLDALGTMLAQKRIFGAKDRKTLDPAAQRELEAIGYGGGER